MKAVREDQHGTTTGYNYGCRCVACRAAVAELGRKYRADHSEELAERRHKRYEAHREDHAEYGRKYRAEHAEEVAECNRKYYAEHREESRAWHLRTTYGLDTDAWDALFTGQGDGCAVCGAEQPGGRNWHTDHDHNTGKVRGILCYQCNVGLGSFKDNPERLMAAIEYLAAATL